MGVRARHREQTTIRRLPATTEKPGHAELGDAIVGEGIRDRRDVDDRLDRVAARAVIGTLAEVAATAVIAGSRVERA